MTTTNIARVETVTFIDPLGETFEVDAFPHADGWMLCFGGNWWVLEHDIHKVSSKPAGYNVRYSTSKDGGITKVEVENLQGYSHFDE